jgi:hypothetical protein
MTLLGFLLLVGEMTVGTWILGWWAVPIVAVLWAVPARRSWRRPALVAALGAAGSWALLLAVDAAGGRLLALGALFARIAGVPAVASLALTLLFPALLAGTAAIVAVDLWPRRKRARGFAQTAPAPGGELPHASREREVAAQP